MIKRAVGILMILYASLAMAFGTTFLKPSEAFEPSISVSPTGLVELKVGLADGIYLYVEQIDVQVVAADGIELDELNVLTPSKDHDGDSVYYGDFEATAQLLNSSSSASMQQIKIEFNFQGCADAGLCYEPQSTVYETEIDPSKLPSATQIERKPIQTQTQTQTDGAISDTDIIVNTLKDGNIWTILLLFFGIGLALSLTPCIFPMIPILSSIIVSQGEGLSAKRGFMLSFVYVIAMAFAYSIAGVLAGLFGENLQVMLQNPYAISAFAFIFVILAFSMFGFYDIALPSSFQTKLSRVSDDASKRGGYIGVAIMGFLSALIVGPCVAPALAAALVYIGQSGSALLGGSALFVLSLGMSAPLLLIGLGAGRFMPKPGGWMSIVTKVFGAVMIAIAIWMMSRILPDETTMTLWALFFIVSAIYLGALERLESSRRSWNALQKATAIIFLIYGVALLVGALSGNSSLSQPLKNLAQTSFIADAKKESLQFKTVKSIDELDQILAQSRGQNIMLDFSAKWCAACEEYEQITFVNSSVIAALSGYTLIKADVSENSPATKALMKKYGVFGPPVVIFFDKNTQILKHKTLVGFTPPEQFLTNLSQ